MKRTVQKRNKTLRLRVKKALEKRKNIKKFTPTIEQCQSWFRILNRGMFIEYRIELHNRYPTWKDFIETLAHEMVHLYQMQVWKDPYSNHNSNFYSWRNYFKQHGLRLYQ